MKAAVVTGYGPPHVVRVVQVKPPGPRDDDVLVRVHAASVNSADARIRGARFPSGFAPFARAAFRIRRPRTTILGGVYSGVVEELGAHVTDLAVGDEVCGMLGLRMGAHAELVAAPAKLCVRRPASVSHEEAAGLFFGGATALHFVRELGRVRAGQTVLVNGASGAVGTMAVQLARHEGAAVTAVCSGPNAHLVRDLGASRVIDHTVTPVSEVAERFDVVIDTVGTLGPTDASRVLAPDGVLLLVTADLRQMLRSRGRVKVGMGPERREGLMLLLDLVSSGDLRVVIDEVLDQADIARAHERIDSGHKVGAIVVRP